METTNSNPGSFSKDCYDKANEAFTNDQYSKAIELYGEALAHDPLNVDYLCARAHAHIKIDQFEKAKTDANKAIGIVMASILPYVSPIILKINSFLLFNL